METGKIEVEDVRLEMEEEMEEEMYREAMKAQKYVPLFGVREEAA